MSGVLARNLQTITSDQLSDGLDLLNAILAVKSANTRLIPYFTEYNFNAVTGQETYFIPNLLAVETFTFYIGLVRYSTSPQKRKTYWGSGRIDNVTSLPFQWEVERQLGGTNLNIYFFPNQNFPLVIFGKFALSQVTLNQDLSTILDLFYIEYLRYALAEQICIDYIIEMQPRAIVRLQELESIIMHISPPDLTLTKLSSMGKEPSLNYADANLGMGWRP